ncbi:Crp/Fnr family transcriptional regulator [Chryseobacterium gossypii]|uniref:Crp/Fnr family transcriptional regulator n=1 Tax=Chryseobacterium gossypii TaxID=3231602 RepID=UPI0035242CF3
MIIDENLLLEYGAKYENYKADEIIFRAGSLPKFYFQIVKGTVELSNYHEDGKEFTQNILMDGQCFGESLLFNDKAYPMNAVAKNECTILKLTKAEFYSLLSQNPETTFNMFRCLADRLYYKYIMLFNISSPDPSFKIKTIMDYYKDYNSDKSPYSYQVPLTRKQIANLTGLRIETVIRTVKKMEKEDILKIENGKIYY